MIRKRREQSKRQVAIRQVSPGATSQCHQYVDSKPEEAKPAEAGATAKPEESLLQSISQQLTCGICLEQYNIPKTLTPCLHTFCKDCLQETINKCATVNATRATFPCPKCRGDVEFDCPNAARKKDAAETEFKTNFDIQNQLQIVKSKIANGCPEHSGEALIYFCTTCKKPVCSVRLLEDHMSQNHVLTSISEESQRIQGCFKNNQRYIEGTYSDNTRLIAQYQSQQKNLSEIQSNAAELIRLLDTTTKKILETQRKAEHQQKQVLQFEEDIQSYQQDYDKLKKLMSGNDLQLILHQKEISDLIESLRVKLPRPQLWEQQVSTESLSKIFSTHIDQLKKMADAKTWKLGSKAAEYKQTVSSYTKKMDFHQPKFFTSRTMSSVVPQQPLTSATEAPDDDWDEDSPLQSLPHATEGSILDDEWIPDSDEDWLE